jgi:hypothetical protein
MDHAEQIEKTNLELWGIYNLQRSSRHNLLYYGARAAWYTSWNLGFQLVASVLSLSAVASFLTIGQDVKGKWISGAIGAISAVCAAVPSVFAYSDQIKKFERLHFCYSQLFHLAKLLALDVRRTGLLTQEQLGSAKVLQDLYSRLGEMDEPNVKSKLSKKYEEEVRGSIPAESLWYAGKDAAGQEDSTPTAAIT